MSSAADRAALRVFLAMIGGRDREMAIEARYFAGGAPRQQWLHARDVAGAARRIIDLGERHEVFVGAAPRRRQGGGKDSVARAWALWADCDSGASVARLETFRPTPTFILRSGGVDGEVSKRHAWWALSEPLRREELEPAAKRLAVALGADPACAEIARVMRPPATWHRKDDEPRPVTVQHCELVSYTAAQVVGRITSRAPECERQVVELAGDDPLRAIPATTYVPILTGHELGRDGKMTCPFHDDRTPSLHAYDDDRGWYCFGCDAGGSIIDLGARLCDIEPRGRGFHDIRRRLLDELLGTAAA